MRCLSYTGPDACWLRAAQPFMASNGGGPSRLQSARLVAAVAELGSLGVSLRILQAKTYAAQSCRRFTRRPSVAPQRSQVRQATAVGRPQDCCHRSPGFVLCAPRGVRCPGVIQTRPTPHPNWPRRCGASIHSVTIPPRRCLRLSSATMYPSGVGLMLARSDTRALQVLPRTSCRSCSTAAEPNSPNQPQTLP
jgi:hypothetical protein